MLVPCGQGADVPPNMEQNRCEVEAGPMNKASLCEAIQGGLHIDSPFNVLLSCVRITLRHWNQFLFVRMLLLSVIPQGAHTSSVSVYVRNIKKCMAEY